MIIAPGDQIPDHCVVVDEQAMKPMAVLLRDPNPIHWDVSSLKTLGLDPRPINQGPTNVAYLWDALGIWLGDTSVVRTLSVRFVSNALAGEQLTAGGTVLTRQVLGDRVVYECEVWLHHADGTDVLRGTARLDLGGWT